MKNSTLYDVRCPNTLETSKGQFTCKALCGKVTCKSMGEFACRRCKTTFSFIINEDGQVTYFGFDRNIINIKK